MSNMSKQHSLQNGESVIKELVFIVITYVSPISNYKCLCDLGV